MIAILSILTFSGCARRQARDQFMLWSETDPGFDSTVRRLEMAYAFDEPADSISNLTEHLERLADADTANRIKTARVHFWKARYYSRFSPYTGERDGMIEKELLLARQNYSDTAAYPYDMLRLAYLENPAIKRDIESSYYHNMRLLKKARMLGDSLTSAGLLNYLGLTYLHLGDSATARECFRQTRDIFASLGMTAWEKRMQLSEAQACDNSHRSRRDSLFSELLGYSIARRDTMFSVVVLHNLFRATGNYRYFDDIIHTVNNDTAGRNINAYARAMIAADLFRRKVHTDSASTLASQAIAGFDSGIIPEYAAVIYHTCAMAMRLQGNYSEATTYLERYVSISDSIARANTNNEMLRKLARQRISENDNLILRAKMRDRTLFLSALLTLAIIAMTAVIAVIRRHNRLKLSKISSDLALTKNKLQLAASRAVVQDNESTITDAIEAIQSLINDDKLSAADGQKVISTLKAQLTNHEELETFQKIFESVHPDFTNRLLAEKPGLSNSDIKLATYIAMQMNNKQISRVMHIAYQSVLTARYRLRSRLNLPKDISLESYLRSFGE